MKIGIEYDGVYSHLLIKDKKSDDLWKTEVCGKEGISLVRLREEGLRDIPGCKNISVIPTKPLDMEPAIRELLDYLGTKKPLNKVTVDILGDQLSLSEYIHCTKVKESILETHPRIAAEWIYDDRNGSLKPEYFTYGSNEPIWWKCSICGYEYQRTIKQRIRIKTCPACTNREVYRGHNDVGSYPELRSQWSKDNPGRPEDYCIGSSFEAKWECSCGNSWICKIRQRKYTGCNACCVAPKKAAKDNNLAVKRSDLLKIWDYDLNATITTPEKELPHSHHEVWWKCEKGHSYLMSIANKVDGHKCRVCRGLQLCIGFNDLAFIVPVE